MDVNFKDLENYVEVKIITADNDATAASTGDATEVTPGDDIDMDPYTSGLVVINYITTLTAAKTLSFGLQKEDSATDGGSKSADVEVLASTVVATGALTASHGVYVIPIPGDTLKSWARFVNLLITPDLSHTSADTVTWSASFIGLKRNA